MTTPGAKGRSLVWPVAGAFLLTASVGAILQGLAVLAVVRPIEAREARARAELVVASFAAAFAASPVPPRGADLDSLLRRERAERSIRPAILAVRLDDGTIASSPPDLRRIASRALSDSAGPSDGRGRNEILARHVLTHGQRPVGEVLVLRRAPRGPGPTEPRLAFLVFVPVAALLSAALALVLVRLLAGRLGALERLAARVEAGDLSARVGDPRRDEIGRVARQLDRMTERLAIARDQVRATEEQRRKLFADITHELATPLTSIRGSAETLLDPKVPMTEEDRLRYLRGLLDESGRMDRLIRDLLELARLEAGASPFQKERLDWAGLVHHTIERFASRSAAAGLRIEWRPPPGQAWVEADGLRLEQVLDNLLVNALRYVPAAGTVTIALERSEDSPDHWRLTVQDDGPGIPADELAHVFERFYRGAVARDSRAAADWGGSGLGLAIVREIVERHGGTARARAAVPRGLTIEIELPAAA